jgi:SulP family sulfate permease
MEMPTDTNPRATPRRKRGPWFRPRILDAIPGYNRQLFLKDLGAGLTVGVVALPLAMAFAIASGLKPEAGLFTAIIAGMLISVLGGSRVQIGGPAGAFIVIVYGILERYGLANLILATAMSGVLLFAMGFFRAGTLIRFIPISVVIGFTNGIAVLIGVSQIKEFLGLKVVAMPADFFGILSTLFKALHTINWEATALALACLGIVVVWQLGIPSLAHRFSWAKRLMLVPGSIVALVRPRCVCHCFSCRWRPLAVALAAFHRLCRVWCGLIFHGTQPAFCSFLPSPWPCWVLSNPCSVRVWQMA